MLITDAEVLNFVRYCPLGRPVIKYGLKNFYYATTPDGDGDTEKEMNCDSGACAICFISIRLSVEFIVVGL